MFYRVEIEDYVRVSPEFFALPVEEAISTQLKKKYLHHIDKELGVTVAGIVASSLIGLVYGSPWMTALMVYAKKRDWFTVHLRNLRPFAFAWAGALVMIMSAEILLAPALMIASTVACVLLTLALSAAMPGILVTRKLR